MGYLRKMVEEYSAFTCSNIGLSGTTAVLVKKHKNGCFEARMGIALLGSANMTEDQMKEARFNPFNESWFDNYVSGKGETEEDAIEALKEDMKEMTDSLWA